MQNINPPNAFDCFGSVFGYDYQIHKWVYDVKFYLSGNHWCFDKEGKRTCRTIDQNELKIIDKYNGVLKYNMYRFLAVIAQIILLFAE